MAKPIYKILIIEDNLSYALELEMMLEEIGHQIVASVDNSRAALDFIYSQRIDIILKGIHVKKNLSDAKLNQQIKQLAIPVILMTAKIDNSKHELSKLSNPIGFFIKPIHPFTLESTINLVLEPLKTSSSKQNNLNATLFKDFIFAKNGNKNYQKILIQDIQCLEAFGNYSCVYTYDDKYMSRLKFKALENIFFPKDFIRVHRSFIINAHHISSINMEEYTIELENSKIIPLSRTHKQRLWSQIKKRML